ncbi:MAG TPA: hypothetical protein P5235_08995 [Saprospiraceae bacterium]|nr:hypothetical protein [Saprospiraceae bacterium]
MVYLINPIGAHKKVIKIFRLSIKSIVILLICNASYSPINAQTQGDSLQIKKSGVDSTKTEIPTNKSYKNTQYSAKGVYQKSLNRIDQWQSFGDTSLEKLHQIYATESKSIHWFSLGNGGSSAAAPYYIPRFYRGLDLGFEQYSLYNFELENYKIYKSDVPFSDVFFSPLFGQENFDVSATHAQSFNDGISISLDYKRRLYTGVFKDQACKTTNFGFSFLYQSKNEKLKLNASYISDVNDETFNGGLDPELYTGELYANTKNIPVFLSEANGRQQSKIYLLHTDFRINNQSDAFGLSVIADFEKTKLYNKFYDKTTNTAKDSMVYAGFLTDSRGLRRYYKNDKTTFASGLIMEFNENFKLISKLIYDHNKYDVELINDIEKDLSLDAALRIRLGETVYINGNFTLGLAENAGNLNLDGQLKYQLSNDFSLNGYFRLFNRKPTLVEQFFVSNGVKNYQNDFSKSFGNTIGGKIQSGKWHSEIELLQHTVNNAIFWNFESKPEQSQDIYLNTILKLKQSISIGSLGLEINAMYQVFNENLYHLPRYWMSGNLYWKLKLFNDHLHSRIGIETSVFEKHASRNFNPLTGQFYLSKSEVSSYPMTNFYIDSKVDKFRVFFRFENITNYFSDTYYYEFVDYPHFNHNFRLGIRWILME